MHNFILYALVFLSTQGLLLCYGKAHELAKLEDKKEEFTDELEEFFEEITDDQSLSQIKKSATEWDENNGKKMNDFVENLKLKMEEAKTKMQGLLGKAIKQENNEAIEGSGEQENDFLETFLGGWKTEIEKLGETIKEIPKQYGNELKTVVQQVLKDLSMLLFGPQGDISGSGEEMFNNFMDDFEGSGSIDMEDKIKQLMSQIKGKVGFEGSGLDNLGEIVKEKFANLDKDAKLLWDKIKEKTSRQSWDEDLIFGKNSKFHIGENFGKVFGQQRDFITKSEGEPFSDVFESNGFGNNVLSDGFTDTPMNLYNKYSGSGSGMFSGMPKDFEEMYKKYSGSGSGMFPSVTGMPKDLEEMYKKYSGSGSGMFPGVTGMPKDLEEMYNKYSGSGSGMFPGTGMPKDLEEMYKKYSGSGSGMFPGFTGIPKDLEEMYKKYSGSGSGMFPGFTGIPKDLEEMYKKYSGSGSGMYPGFTGMPKDLEEMYKKYSGSGSGMFPGFTGTPKDLADMYKKYSVPGGMFTGMPKDMAGYPADGHSGMTTTYKPKATKNKTSKPQQNSQQNEKQKSSNAGKQRKSVMRLMGSIKDLKN